MQTARGLHVARDRQGCSGPTPLTLSLRQPSEIRKSEAMSGLSCQVLGGLAAPHLTDGLSFVSQELSDCQNGGSALG
jgi:hypothetical protein